MTDETLRRSDELLTELIEVVETARAVPMSASCVLPRERVLDLLDELREVMPPEMDEARTVIARVTASSRMPTSRRPTRGSNAVTEADAVLADAAHRAEQMLAEAAAEPRRSVAPPARNTSSSCRRHRRAPGGGRSGPRPARGRRALPGRDRRAGAGVRPPRAGRGRPARRRGAGGVRAVRDQTDRRRRGLRRADPRRTRRRPAPGGRDRRPGPVRARPATGGPVDGSGSAPRLRFRPERGSR